jgi:hypothetical protein
MLNWSEEAIWLLISFIPFFLSFYLLFREFIRYRDKAMLCLMIAWLSYGFYWVIEAISYIIMSPQLFVSRAWVAVIMSFSVAVGLDLINKDTINVLKMSLISGLSVFTIIATFFPSSVEVYYYENGDLSYSTSGYLFYGILLIMIVIAISYFYYMLKIYRKSPPNLKNKARWNLIGAILIGPVVLFLYFIRASYYFPGIIAITSAIGGLMSAIVFVRTPQLTNVLPARAVKLVIVQEDPSLLLYIHRWFNENQSNQQTIDLIFSGMLSGIVRFIKTALKSGEIEEIKIKKAVLLVRYIPGLSQIVVLLATNSTRSLRQSFNRFVNQYVEYCGNEIQKDYAFVKDFITRSFPYLPYSDADDEIMKKLGLDSSQSPKLPSEELKNDISMKNSTNMPVSNTSVSSLCISCHNVKSTAGQWMNLKRYYQQTQAQKLAWELCPNCNKEEDILVLSYFDNMIGPQILYNLPENPLPKELRDIATLLDMQKDDFFIFTMNDIKIANLPFNIKKKTARGGQIPFLLSYTVFNTKLNEDFAKLFLTDCVNEMLSIPNIQELFENPTDAKMSSQLKINLDLFQQVKSILQKNLHIIREKKIQNYIEKEID